MLTPFFKSSNRDFTLVKGDCFELLTQFDFKFNTIFADPPYFLSNDGISVQSGKQVSVNKGEWDKSHGLAHTDEFNRQWLTLCHQKLADHGTLWVTGTIHNIYSVAQQMGQIGYKILNCITWQKPNPPPNLTKRCFTHSTEFILWAKKSPRSKHFFNYELMKTLNGGTQMRDLWTLPAIAKWEKSCGKHPTQKPLPLLARIILASTPVDAWVLDPFCGSATTGIAANLLNRKFLGLEQESVFLELAKNRRLELDNPLIKEHYLKKISLNTAPSILHPVTLSEALTPYGSGLPFH